MTDSVRAFINSIPDKRVSLALSHALDRTLPTGRDTGLTATAGGVQATALALKGYSAFHEDTTVATAADAVALPPARVGEWHFVKNSGAASMQVFGSGTDTIDSVATATGVAQPAGDAVLYVCLVGGNYIRLGGVGATEVFGALTVDSIAGGDSSLGITGQAAAQGGAVAVAGGTSATAGNAGGAASLTGGTPGSTGVGGAANLVGSAGGSASGKGGAANVTGGAGTAGNASGGSAVLGGGAKHGSGLDGGVFNRGTFQLRKQPAPQTAADTDTLTVAQMLGGLLVATPTAAAAYTMATGTALKAALPTDLAADDSFDLIISNIGGTGDDITLTASTDITIVGDPVVGPLADVATEQSSLGRFRLRFTTGVTFVAYRVG